MVATKWKDNVTAQDLVVSCAINAMFTTMALLDYSASTWAISVDRLGFLGEYVAWKGADGGQPVLRWIMFPMLLMFPIVIVAIFFGALQTLLGWRRATPVRHVCDLVEAITISTIIYAIAQLIPAQAAVGDACAGAMKSAAERATCKAAAVVLDGLHLQLVLYNLVMFAMPCVKYGKGSPAGADAAKKAN